MKCENCTKYDDCRTGSGLTWPCGAYRPKTGGGMDIEKLIEQLRKSADFEDYPIVASFAAIIEKKYLRAAATALSTLQIENQAFRNSANGFKAENEKLREELESLKKGHCAGCSVQVVETEALRDLNDAPKLRAELEQVKQELDTAVECVNTVYSYILIKSKTEAVRTIEKWLRGQKEG